MHECNAEMHDMLVDIRAHTSIHMHTIRHDETIVSDKAYVSRHKHGEAKKSRDVSKRSNARVRQSSILSFSSEHFTTRKLRRRWDFWNTAKSF